MTEESNAAEAEQIENNDVSEADQYAALDAEIFGEKEENDSDLSPAADKKGDEPGNPGEPEEGDEENDEEGEEEGEQEEIEVSEEDYKKTIKLSIDGQQQKMSLGELKDIATKGIEIETREAQIADSRQQLANEQREFYNIQQLSGVQISPEQREQARQIEKRTLLRESELILKALPEWRDPKVYEHDRAAMVEYGQSFGMTEQELGQIKDSRVVRMLKAAEKDRRELFELRESAKLARKEAKKKQTGGGRTAPGTQHGKGTFKAVDRAQTEAEKFAAMDQILVRR